MSLILTQTHTWRVPCPIVFRARISRRAEHNASCFASAGFEFGMLLALLAHALKLITLHTPCQVNRLKMQVFHDIATVTVQLIDLCCSCCNGITWPVKSEICAHSLCRWCFTEAWTMKNERSPARAVFYNHLSDKNLATQLDERCMTSVIQIQFN